MEIGKNKEFFLIPICITESLYTNSMFMYEDQYFSDTCMPIFLEALFIQAKTGK